MNKPTPTQEKDKKEALVGQDIPLSLQGEGRGEGLPQPENGPHLNPLPKGRGLEVKEIGGRGGLDPVRYGDWEIGGKCVDF